MGKCFMKYGRVELKSLRKHSKSLNSSLSLMCGIVNENDVINLMENIQSNCDFPGNDILIEKAENYFECAVKCFSSKNKMSCTHFVFNPTVEFGCFLKQGSISLSNLDIVSNDKIKCGILAEDSINLMELVKSKMKTLNVEEKGEWCACPCMVRTPI